MSDVFQSDMSPGFTRKFIGLRAQLALAIPRLRLRARRTVTAEEKKRLVLLDSGVRRNDGSSTKSEPSDPNEPNDLNALNETDTISDKHQHHQLMGTVNAVDEFEFDIGGFGRT